MKRNLAGRFGIVPQRHPNRAALGLERRAEVKALLARTSERRAEYLAASSGTTWKHVVEHVRGLKSERSHKT
jgi:hypothetical protein